MEFSTIAGYENIPEGSYVIKVKNILAYIHYDKFELVSFKDAYEEMKLIQRQLKYN